ncbi:MAG: protein-L-isoaspartate(D-aspartate) O-methyltransferase [Burkholderiaceae bacterium]|nr:protein-L-isoaspartate(D-aspartate) O-methyltransferase [Burkholderiaceae bacterium]
MRRHRRRLLAALAALPAARPFHAARAQDDYAQRRRALRLEVERQIERLAPQTGHARLSACVARALEQVPRHRFVPPELAGQAYENRPLPIGHGQTISQPLIVALMTDLLAPQPDHRVLEIGTGSGYHAAVLAQCVAQVYTIEIVPALAKRAAALLAELGYRNVEVRSGNGAEGWPEAAPFDKIVVTAAPEHVPPALLAQLAAGGRLVIPVGPQSAGQELLLIRKEADGRTVTRRTIPVRFVPLVRGDR